MQLPILFVLGVSFSYITPLPYQGSLINRSENFQPSVMRAAANHSFFRGNRKSPSQLYVFNTLFLYE